MHIDTGVLSGSFFCFQIRKSPQFAQDTKVNLYKETLPDSHAGQLKVKDEFTQGDEIRR